MIPISTMTPIAIAIPESALRLASTPKAFIIMKVMSTAKGRTREMRAELIRLVTMTITTMIATRVSSERAFFRVPRVSWIS